MTTWESLSGIWPILLAVVDIALACVTSAHVVMYKRDSRSAIAWVGLVWLAPIVGSLLYVVLGVNRIRRRSLALRSPAPAGGRSSASESADAGPPVSFPGARHPGLCGLARLVSRLTARPLLPGNEVTPLVGGDEAYPSMLEAIARAERSIALSTYIFDNDRAGREFLETLDGARKRGVDVRIIVDDVGSRYTRPSMVRKLRALGLRVEAFLPTRVPRLFHYANLRNHRKILVVDGKVGFTGGMNIREGHRLSLEPGSPIQDVHFKILGPVVRDLQETFSSDWTFVTGEPLQGEPWFPDLSAVGEVWARGIPDGPDDDFERARLTILGAIAAATRRIHVVTPYFVPDAPLITALNVAALAGVEVNIILPEENNIPLVHWACRSILWQVLERGCRVWYSAPPFDHTKLILVDDAWTLLGSSNWDTRSLRLNFEFNVECHDEKLAAALGRLVESKVRKSREVTFEEVESRTTPQRIRDGAARLLSPFM